MNGINGYGVYKSNFFDVNGVSKPKGPSKSEKKNNGDEMAAVYERDESVQYGADGKIIGESSDVSAKALSRSGGFDVSTLSEKAQELLKELREKYGNLDIFVGDTTSEQFASESMARSTKEYSMIIDAETLESMAADDSVKEAYMGQIDDALNQIDNIKEELEESEEGTQVESISITVSSDGTVSFFAKLREANAEIQEKLAEKRAEKKEEAKAEEKKAKDKELHEKTLDKKDEVEDKKIEKSSYYTGREATVSASSAAELLEKIKGFSWDDKTETAYVSGGFDFSV